MQLELQPQQVQPQPGPKTCPACPAGWQLPLPAAPSTVRPTPCLASLLLDDDDLNRRPHSLKHKE